MTSRTLQKHRGRVRNEARELLQSFFLAELIDPSSTLWIVSPWLRNIELLDNSGGAFDMLLGDAPRRMLRLSDIVGSLLLANVRIVIAIRSPRDDGGLTPELVEMARNMDRSQQLRVTEESNLHSKGIVGDHAAIMGSMNVTFAGLDTHSELLHFTTESEQVAQLALEFSAMYGR